MGGFQSLSCYTKQHAGSFSGMPTWALDGCRCGACPVGVTMVLRHILAVLTIWHQDMDVSQCKAQAGHGPMPRLRKLVLLQHPSKYSPLPLSRPFSGQAWCVVGGLHERPAYHVSYVLC